MFWKKNKKPTIAYIKRNHIIFAVFDGDELKRVIQKVVPEHGTWDVMINHDECPYTNLRLRIFDSAGDSIFIYQHSSSRISYIVERFESELDASHYRGEIERKYGK